MDKKVENRLENKSDNNSEVMTTDKKSDKKSDKKELGKNNIIKEIISWIAVFAIAFTIAFVLKTKVFILANIPSSSMEETIMTGDQVFGNRLAYNSADPQRGDIAIFYAPDKPDTLYIKRVIGLPGDKVVIDDAKIYINDSKESLDEPYINGKWTKETGYYEYQVPEGCYFMLGDNRNYSEDARDWENTYVKRDKIVAKAECIYFPFGHIKQLKTYDYKNN